MTIAMTLAPLTLSAKVANEAKKNTKVADGSPVEGATITEPSTKKRKKVTKKAVVACNPAVIASEVVAHKTKTKK